MGRPRKMQNFFDAPKDNRQYSEGQKSKGILEDDSTRQVLRAKEIILGGVNRTTWPTGLSITGTDHNIVRMDGTSAIQDSLFAIADDGKFYLASDASSYFYLGSFITFVSGGNIGWSLGDDIGNRAFNITNQSGTAKWDCNSLGVVRMRNTLNMLTNKIENVVDPTAAQEAATKKYHDDNIYSIPTGVDHTIARYDGTNEIQDSGIDIDDADNITAPLCRINASGGYDIRLMNATGGASVLGNLVEADPATPGGFIITFPGSLNAIGAVAEAGIANGSLCWVTIAGIATVLIDAAACVAGDRIVTAGGLGAGLGTPNNAPAVAVHFQEVGHCIIGSGGAAGPAIVVLHFN